VLGASSLAMVSMVMCDDRIQMIVLEVAEKLLVESCFCVVG